MTTYFNEEFNLTRKINWGQKYFDSVNDPGRDDRVLAARPRVQYMLEHAVETETGPIDATPLLKMLSDDELCEFFSRVPKCQILILQKWNVLTEKVMRCISFSLGASITELDLSFSMVSIVELAVLLSNTSGIRVLKLEKCTKFESKAMSMIAKTCQRSMTELYVSDCQQIKVDPLLWMCGCIGINAPKLFKLRVLDLSFCPILDGGLKAVAGTCRQLRFLNLNECVNITDDSFIEVALACRHLEVVNLYGCSLLTNKSILTLAANCPKLSSLNVAKLNKLSDHAVIELSKYTSKLQALNLAGLKKITEQSLCDLALGCPGIMMLNVTGCELITAAGLRALTHELEYVELGISFVGLKPIEAHIEKKLTNQLAMIFDTAANTIGRSFVAIQKKLQTKAEYKTERINKAADQIKGSIYRYTRRLFYYHIYFEKLKVSCALTIQRVTRGNVGRKIAKAKRDYAAYLKTKEPWALKIQRVYRGFKTRRSNVRLNRVLLEMLITRREEAQAALAVRLQSIARKYLARGRFVVSRELFTRRNIDESAAIVTLQCLARIFLAKMFVQRKISDQLRIGAIQDVAATRIQSFYRATKGTFRTKQSKKEREMAGRKRQKAAICAQRILRGFFARQRVARIRIGLATKYFAATCIQRIYRSTRIMRWQDMRLNVISAYVLDRQYLERRESVAASRIRYKAYIEENRRDSCSEEEPAELVINWVKKYDEQKRRPYWYSEYLNQITYDEPLEPAAMAKGLVGVRIRVYWIAQQVWYEGLIARYHRRKKRHRINYDDGDHEWMNLEDERDRVQIQQEDGSWVLYVLYRPQELLEDWRKLEQARQTEDFKRQAFIDAQDWSIISSDVSGDVTIMWISNKSGAIRTGKQDSGQWTVHDDGYGFPCFYNAVTGVTVSDDPRFEDDESTDMKHQKEYVMQELRIAVYFCSDFWERYSKAIDEKRKMHICMLIRNSQKPKHLVAFLIRAKALYVQVSVVDEPIAPNLQKELDYASWLAEQISILVQLAEEKILVARDAQAIQYSKLLGKSKGKVYCTNCKRETKRHYEFCQICGKRQLFLLDHIDDEHVEEKLSKSEIHALKTEALEALS